VTMAKSLGFGHTSHHGSRYVSTAMQPKIQLWCVSFERVHCDTVSLGECGLFACKSIAILVRRFVWSRIYSMEGKIN